LQFGHGTSEGPEIARWLLRLPWLACDVFFFGSDIGTYLLQTGAIRPAQRFQGQVQNDMLAQYLTQVKRIVVADVHLVVFLEARGASPVREMRFGMHLFLDGEGHVLAVLVETPGAGECNVSRTISADRDAATGVREPDRAGDQSLLSVAQQRGDWQDECRADRLLQQRADIESGAQGAALEGFEGEHERT